MITVREIQRTVARNFNVAENEFFSHCRYRDVAQPRQIAMMLSRELTKYSLPRIAQCFNRDHTTIMHGISAAKKLVSEDPEVAGKVNTIRWLLIENYVRKQVAWGIAA